MTVDVAAVSYVLSSMASVGKILESVKAFSGQKGRSPTLTEFQDLEAKTKAEIDQVESRGAYRDARLAGMMSGDMVDAIREEMERISRTVVETFTDDSLSDEQKEHLINEQQKKYCWRLSFTKRFCGGVLPPDLQQEWDKNLCGRF